MPEGLSDWAILGGVLLWDLAVVSYILRLARPPWRRKIRVPRTLEGRITYDRDEWGNPVQ
jgi:hypothetical protein